MIIRNFLFCKNMGLIRKNLLFIKGPVFFILHVSYIHRCKTSWRGLKQKSSKKLESAVSKCNSSKAGFSITLIPSFCHVQWRCCLIISVSTVYVVLLFEECKKVQLIFVFCIQFCTVPAFYFAGCWWIRSCIFWWRGPLWQWGTRTWQINLSTSDASHRRAIWENWVSWTCLGECVRLFKLWTS